MKTDNLIVFSLFLIIIALSVWFSTTPSYVPYSSTIFRNYSKFEGFAPLEYSNLSSSTDVVSNKNASSNDIKSTCKRVAGYNGYGLFCDPTFASSEKIDIYSQAAGSLTCDGYGYFNSRGSLCLDDKMKNQLLTRGMNASGSPSLIGGSAV